MNKETQEKLDILIGSVRKELNNQDNFYIKHFMPETGTFFTDDKDCDENGNWGLVNSSVTVTEEDALSEAQTELLENVDYLEEFFFETGLRGKMYDFMKAICKENING